MKIFQRQANRRAGLEIFVAVIMFAFGAFGLYSGIKAGLEWQDAKDWPSTTGEITLSELRSEREPVGDDYRTAYELHMRYTYTVDGKLYQSSRVWFANQQLGLGRSRDVVERYPVGAQAEVFYNPADPSKAVLDTSPGPVWLLGGLGVLFMGLSVFIIVRANRKKNTLEDYDPLHQMMSDALEQIRDQS